MTVISAASRDKYVDLQLALKLPGLVLAISQGPEELYKLKSEVNDLPSLEMMNMERFGAFGTCTPFCHGSCPTSGEPRIRLPAPFSFLIEYGRNAGYKIGERQLHNETLPTTL
ncbi:hypothetical protein Mapa_000401 [Marchantia paleacea]|nr:hypothetical protein Mapa_000401 [Marchantia paleacea]